ncbi:MAG TPA: ribose 5-phosphate isomerase A [Longimicrobiales bacterium]|nr:ribose 5-phosphate isomerase A [Longimicrobiales bacterium]
MSEVDRLKRDAAERALDFVEDGMVLGLGTGSTVRHLLELLAERRKAGALRRVIGVPTSRATEWLARELGLRISSLEQEPRVDLTIDGADEVDPQLNLIKGLGGALLWEKIVASASERLLIVADEAKLVARLGERAPLPVEVVPFGWNTHLAFLDNLGAEPMLRLSANGSPFLTDSGHYLIDCHFPHGITEPIRLQRELRQHAGVVESGLFLGLADAVVVAGLSGTRVLRPEGVSG